MVHRALADRSQEQGAVGGLGKDFPGTKIAEQRPELGLCYGGKRAARPAQGTVACCRCYPAMLRDC